MQAIARAEYSAPSPQGLLSMTWIDERGSRANIILCSRIMFVLPWRRLNANAFVRTYRLDIRTDGDLRLCRRVRRILGITGFVLTVACKLWLLGLTEY